MDELVGRVLAVLDEQKLADRTVIFFTSDNGGLTRLGRQGPNPTNNSPLREGKGSPYEGGVRVPLVVRWPGVIQLGSTCDEPVISVDFFPTILEIAGLAKPPEAGTVDGVSLVPVLKDPKSRLPREAIYWHYPHYHPGGATPYGAIRAGDWKLIEFYEDMHVELYNLKDDLGETTDLAGKMPQQAARLRQMLHRWRQSVGAQMPQPNPNGAKPSSAPSLPSKEKVPKP
jgi:arylsulfatase A-like enzyme